MARYLRPCYLTWNFEEAYTVFGADFMAEASKDSAAAGLEMHGILARPLYASTAWGRAGRRVSCACA